MTDFYNELISVATIFCTLLFSYSVASEYGYTVAVEAGKRDCFYQAIASEKAANVELEYQVLDGGDLDIMFTLYDPNTNVLFEDERRTDNAHKFDVSQLKGDYMLCFDNSFSYSTSKIVFFQMFVYDADGNTEDLDYKKTAHHELNQQANEIGVTIEEFNAVSNRMKGNLNRAEHMQNILRSYEARDQVIMVANYERVNFWSVVNLVVMVVVSVTQVYMIKSLFQDTSKMGKLFRHRT